MAKMTKAAVKVMAEKAADTQRDAFTLDELDALAYDIKRAEALKLAQIAVGTAKAIDTSALSDTDVAVFIDTFTNRLTSLWASRVKARDDARNRWRRALTGLTQEQAAEKIHALLVAMNVRGAVIDNYSGTRLEVRRGDVEATLYISLDRDHDSKQTNPDDFHQTVGTFTVETGISWSGTTYSLATATVAVGIYHDLINAAAEVEATMRRERIIWTYGIEAKAEVANA